ncbi:hypothetical protein C3942_14680 [Solimonas fluminis]|uniref:Uncharacterized protein n=1 Tax=Solimonas fluminis TaxID=2086571 RepID=A0A2S5TDU5_9GAMM|nr:hypothetical protein C3942_14680 [Solimonas fluminis]
MAPEREYRDQARYICDRHFGDLFRDGGIVRWCLRQLSPTIKPIQPLLRSETVLLKGLKQPRRLLRATAFTPQSGPLRLERPPFPRRQQELDNPPPDFC